MFVNTILNRNPGLVDWALYAHQNGQLLPNTYVIDLDTVAQNAQTMAKTASTCGLNLYMMTKQIARNPIVCQTVYQCGIRKAVAVTMDEALTLHSLGIPIGHLGHLVQIPEHQVDQALSLNPEVITVMDLENAQKIARHAQRIGRCQDLLLRVTGPDDMLYAQQRGGIAPAELETSIEQIESLCGVRVVGFTAFPCYSVDWSIGQTVKTTNYSTLMQAVAIARRMGICVRQINAPGGNGSDFFAEAARDGVTHLEPGHSLTGTTYQNAVDDQCAEKPAMVYLTEVSHNWNGKSCVFGGGFYGRARINHAIVRENGTFSIKKAFAPTPGNIDYYGELDCRLPVGTGVVYAFRTQIFMLHSDVAIVAGLSEGRPKLLGIFGKNGMKLQ